MGLWWTITLTLWMLGTFHRMEIIAGSIWNKDIPEKNTWIPTILKEEVIERKESIKLHWHQQKDVCSFSKMILTTLKDIKKRVSVFNTVLNLYLLWHTSEIFHKAEKQRPRPNWNGLMDQPTSDRNKFTNKYHYNVTTHWS